MRVHFIAIGGSAMHNLAIALKIKGFEVTGSDDEIFDPAKGRLAKYGILPQDIGWHPEKITPDLDAVILGMHAREDNPELLKAKELNLKIYSYPEYLYEQSKDKTRVVGWWKPRQNHHHLHDHPRVAAPPHRLRLHGGGAAGWFRGDGTPV